VSLLPALLVEVRMPHGKHKELVKRCEYTPKYSKVKSHLGILHLLSLGCLGPDLSPFKETAALALTSEPFKQHRECLAV